MKLRLILLCLAGLSASLSGEESGTVPSKDRRAAVIAAGSKWIDSVEVPIPPEVKNPFSMKGFEVVAVRTTDAPNSNAKPTSDHDLVEALAARVDAKGRFVMNGEVMLLVGGKKLKEGSKMSVTYQGLIYEIELAAIDIAKFTVRYKTEEFTRPITQKPVKTP